MNRRIRSVVIALVALALLGPASAFVYFNVIQGDPPEKLSLESSASDDTATTATAPAATDDSDLAGTWKPTAASQVGYRVKEVAFGQSQTAVGRTNKVTGTLIIAADKVSAVDLTVDMASVASDESRRDNQFRNRIMATGTYPTSRFVLTQPIALSSTSGTVSTKATGQLTLRGTTKAVTMDLKAVRDGDTFKVNGLVPITFSEWNIPNPSFGPVSTEDNGELELLVVFAKA